MNGRQGSRTGNVIGDSKLSGADESMFVPTAVILETGNVDADHFDRPSLFLESRKAPG